MNNYNIDQMTLSIPLDYKPKENHPARFINDLVESLNIEKVYSSGRPREYDLRAMLKLILFAYSRSVMTSRKIEEFAEENIVARWLTQYQVPSYRTICRFRISDEIETLLDDSLTNLTSVLKQNGLIDEVSFIDGTKILADANKFSFVWKKNTIRFDDMNKSQIQNLLSEINEVRLGIVENPSDLSDDALEEVQIKLELHLEDLNARIEANPKKSPNPDKQERRKLKSYSRKLDNRIDKKSEHEKQMKKFDKRNSYAKSDEDATFMRVKEDPMLNGQLKPAYNVQIATSNQFITGVGMFQNPTDTRTLIPFIKQREENHTLGDVIVADAGYGSESNYQFLDDNYKKYVIPYSTMLKENSKKWKTDEKKVMNWNYYEDDDYYINPQGVRFSFNAYRIRTDKYGFKRYFKEYISEIFDDDHNRIPQAFTPGGNRKRIYINPSLGYFKASMRSKLSIPQYADIYARRKNDVEPVFGNMKACLGFKRFHVKGLNKVKKEMMIVVMALNIRKLVSMSFFICIFREQKSSMWNFFKFASNF
ncbi:IS1182 family transposase [Companilactobacillus paralimentarius]|uniref:IS1182 family transposase n=1 Tax=Companilactobacillus paralimentarius TaxID=83526 RepID=UPI0028531E51|nr:IS1182 family transposase [Companilactobacillus paralimentarius]MDR4933991.1 IS1182 family transposase [Companilactobacillus paralimentarius]